MRNEQSSGEVPSAGRRFNNSLDAFFGGPAIARPRPRLTPPIMELRHIDASYGPFRALFDVSFRLQPGKATALLGSNGAGKTTVARVVSGLVQPTDGRIMFDGHEVTGFSAWELSRLGVSHVPEGRAVFGSLTVQENLELAFRQLCGRKKAPEALRTAFELFPALASHKKQLAGTLSGGQQRMLSLARALPDPPRLLIADELSLGLAPLIVDEVFEMLAQLLQLGTALLIVEQHVERAVQLAEHTILLRKGRVIYDGPTAEAGEALESVLPTRTAGAPTS